ncbi:unnamed protein product [Timema podura]|uniref:Uncharacterized protein n=1 Tax=Timema podura TaxID=61482 RepID=A0ABN7PBC6_TIMPD|nr:unnamed protein product [Timema podura]
MLSVFGATWARTPEHQYVYWSATVELSMLGFINSVGLPRGYNSYDSFGKSARISTASYYPFGLYALTFIPKLHLSNDRYSSAIILCMSTERLPCSLNPGPLAQKSDTLPLDHQVTDGIHVSSTAVLQDVEVCSATRLTPMQSVVHAC